MLKRRLHKLLLQIPLFLSVACLAVGSLSSDLAVTARKVTGLRSVRPEVKSAPVHPCLKCCPQAAALPCVFLPCHVPCSWGLCLWELLQSFAPCLGFRKQAVSWLRCCWVLAAVDSPLSPVLLLSWGYWAAAGSLAHSAEQSHPGLTLSVCCTACCSSEFSFLLTLPVSSTAV